MKKTLGWVWVVLMVLCILAYTFFNILVDSSTSVREAALAKVRARAATMSNVPTTPLLPSKAASHVVTTEPLAVLDCETRAGQWAALQEQINFATLTNFDAEFSSVRAFQDSGYDLTALPEEKWAELSELAASRTEEIGEIKALARNYDPACLFLQQLDAFNGVGYSAFEILLRIDLALALYSNDYDRAIEDFALLVPLAYRGRGRSFPQEIRPELVNLILSAVHAKHVRSETWELLSARLLEFRHRNFLIHHLLNYPKSQRKSIDRKISTAERLSREFVYMTSEPSRNTDVARWEPVMQELADLSADPYYVAKPILQNIIRTHELGKTDLESYFPDSPARSCISIAATSAFIEHATCQVRIDLLCIAIALARFHEDHETYPESLEAIAAYVGGVVPINPVNGQPYHYEAVGGAYRLGFGPEEAACFRGALNAFGTYVGPEGCTMETRPPPARVK